MSDIELAAPWLLLLLPMPWLVRTLLPSATTQQRNGLRVPFFESVATVIKRDQRLAAPRAPHIRQSLALLAWAALVIAAAGPQWLGEFIELPRSGRDVMLAIDLSGSMGLPDMEFGGQHFNRLQAVKIVGGDFIQHRTNDRVGLILFGSKAYLQTPLTFDLDTVHTLLNDATIGLAGRRTALGDAIGLAVKRLKQPNTTKNSSSKQQQKVLILLTDGANNSGRLSPLDAAGLAAKYHIRIYTIGVGADRLVVKGLFSQQVVNPSADLDENTLKQIAKITGGTYFRAKDTDGLASIYRTLDKLEPVNKDTHRYRPITPLYPYPLALALLLSVLLSLQSLQLRLPIQRKEMPRVNH